ncbi:MAG: DUF4115 domain-containing protein [Leptothrix sp. (in: Bacteria)]|nr:DUF4115 domain-containing protein [Leptothrix sp. (in: b-proteobacteria)]
MTEPDRGPATAGSLLRAAREKQGLHIAALAAAIKVSPRKLDALENDRYEELPDATFVRALAQTVCRTLKVDARPVLDLLPPAASVVLEPGKGGLGTPFRERPARTEPGLSVSGVRPLVWAAAILVLAALVIYLVPAAWWSALLPAPQAADTAPAVGALPAPAPASAPVAVVSSAAPPPDSVLAPAEAAASQPRIETVFSAPPDEAASGAAAAVSGMLQLRCAEESWVEVRDGRNRVLLSRNVQADERVGLDGALPLRLVIGNAAATQLAFRGKPVNLAASTRDNVARLELP